jgi:hypothetical protein
MYKSNNMQKELIFIDHETTHICWPKWPVDRIYCPSEAISAWKDIRNFAEVKQ